MGKFILLTSEPRTGKSTVISKVIGKVQKNECNGFFTTETTNENNERTGFQINTLSGKKGLLASKNYTDSKLKVADFGVDLETFEKLCLEEFEKKGKVFIIDEIGPMQVYSEKYRELLLDLCEKKGIIVVGTVCKASHPWIDKLKEKDNVELVNLTLENRDLLPDIISTRINKYIECSKETER